MSARKAIRYSPGGTPLYNSGGSRGGARGGPGPPLFFDQNEARTVEKLFLESGPPLSQGLDDRAPLLSESDPPLYKPYRYVPPHRVGFLRRFGLKTGTDFDHFDLESMVYKGTTDLYQCLRRFNFK